MVQVQSRSFERRLKSMIPGSLKNVFVRLAGNAVVGTVVKAVNPKKNAFGGIFDYSNVPAHEAARIFFGLWESAEIRFSKRFATTSTVIELGSSVGVTLGVLAAHRTDVTFICVEASAVNFDKLTALKPHLPSTNTYHLLHKAIAYGTDTVEFEHTSTTGSKVENGAAASGGVYTVEGMTLSKILETHDVANGFTLITDIEGAEAQIFFEDTAALEGCHRIVAELEDCDYATLEGQITQLNSLGFTTLERYGNVVVFEKVPA